MRVSELLIDLNDIYGRLIPGFFLICGLYALLSFFIPINHQQFLEFFNEYSFMYFISIVVLLLLSHIIGEFPLYITFRLRYLVPRKTELEVISSADVTKEGELISFFKSRFNTKELNSTKDNLMNYCKDLLLQDSYEAYVRVRKIEARINLRGGMIIPLLVIAITCLLYQQWIIAILFLLLTVIYAIGFYTSYLEEHKIVFLAYFNYWKNLKT